MNCFLEILCESLICHVNPRNFSSFTVFRMKYTALPSPSTTRATRAPPRARRSTASPASARCARRRCSRRSRASGLSVRRTFRAWNVCCQKTRRQPYTFIFMKKRTEKRDDRRLPAACRSGGKGEKETQFLSSLPTIFEKTG